MDFEKIEQEQKQNLSQNQGNQDASLNKNVPKKTESKAEKGIPRKIWWGIIGGVVVVTIAFIVIVNLI